ncbi:MAG: polysaccharide deacetylase family protein [Methyloceanibacter sp.]|nr:polysaccharide deacetylase family protein [Methyloceanibacter sp.]
MKKVLSGPVRQRISRLLAERRSLGRAVHFGMALMRQFTSAPNGIYVLCYHHMQHSHQESLDRQFSYLARHARFVDADEAVDLVASGIEMDERRVLVTVDDGYRDAALSMLPVLRAHHVRAINFVIAGRLAGGYLSDVMETPEGDGSEYMSIEDIETWLDAGMQVGSHSQNHRHLIDLSRGEIATELEQSRAALMAATGTAVDHFACPWGVPGFDFPTYAQEVAIKAGYSSFFTTQRAVATSRTDPFCFPRFVLEPDWDLFELDAILA